MLEHFQTVVEEIAEAFEEVTKVLEDYQTTVEEITKALEH
ncbi:hypothetical protein FEM21_14090 [Flavobacterium seoulense]|uniref:Uncharacterized protein n=1 Tax=Flavobacterium seoulense TaxID=1492738 RepID=A0A066WNV0_9FLAO|nr:hypothetical protein FEM21_14090 [Flavobacterium seoulense]